jgi:ppGpp synthetase/RelA/SpoT-type nucleotidyltranferase
MERVEEGRQRWTEERPTSAAFAECLRKRIAATMKKGGFSCEVSARAKEVDSLVKKLITKPHYTYESLPDKVGARIVLRYRWELEPVIELMRASFATGKIENKSDEMDEDQVGYLSHHVDRCSFLEGDPDAGTYPPRTYYSELQVRTKAQHLWAEMSHDLVYKGPRRTRDLDRRVNLMAAQIEVADREFERLGRELGQTLEGRALALLERYYFRLTSRPPKSELTLVVLQQLLPELKLDEAYFAKDGELDLFLAGKFEKLAVAYDRAQSLSDTGLMHQPEALLLYERMEADSLALQRAWNAHFPPKELERLAPFFGQSFE